MTRAPSSSISLFIAGVKGLNLLRNLIVDTKIDIVYSYESKGTICGSYDKIRDICASKSVPFARKDQFRSGSLDGSHLIFCAGWQFLIHEIDSRFIVFHDSLLPKYRGFAPTVAALIAGDTRIGVSAFQPEPGVDTGAILDQEPLDITYPVTIRDTYQQLGGVYANLAKRLLAKAERAPLQGIAQIESEATYSLWRDEDDYVIDWTQSAAQIRRFIDAVGWPYLGAKTRYLGEDIRIGQAETLQDLRFVSRQPGKLWAIGPTRSTAEVVCGDGLIRILEANFADGRPVLFTSLRQRLGR